MARRSDSRVSLLRDHRQNLLIPLIGEEQNIVTACLFKVFTQGSRVFHDLIQRTLIDRKAETVTMSANKIPEGMTIMECWGQQPDA